MTSTIDRDAFDFFRAHAGGIVGQTAITAAALARAEKRARDLGIYFAWSWDPTYILDDHDDWCGRDDCRHSVESCWARADLGDGQEIDLADLHEIIDSTDDYRRVVMADLALEALDEYDRLIAESVYWDGEPLTEAA